MPESPLISEPPNSFLDRLQAGATNLFGRSTTAPKGGLLTTPNRVEPTVVTNLSKGSSSTDSTGKSTATSKDLRAKLKVPRSYLTYLTNGYAGIFDQVGGILFPYTPSISYDVKADYTSQTPVHSNFAQYFYQRSSVTPISLTAKFTVQNQKDAEFYLSTIMLLKSLTKLQVGKDLRAGSPPPVCRLFAYGEFMLENVPVVVQNFRIELPDSVDYWTIGKDYTYSFGVNSVPVMSTLTINFIPMYSRQEMQQFSVNDFINQGSSSAFRKKGYL